MSGDWYIQGKVPAIAEFLNYLDGATIHGGGQCPVVFVSLWRPNTHTWNNLFKGHFLSLSAFASPFRQLSPAAQNGINAGLFTADKSIPRMKSFFGMGPVLSVRVSIDNRTIGGRSPHIEFNQSSVPFSLLSFAWLQIQNSEVAARLAENETLLVGENIDGFVSWTKQHEVETENAIFDADDDWTVNPAFGAGDE